MKKCAKTVHITTWLLVLLTLQHHYIQRTNNFLNFYDLFAPIGEDTLTFLKSKNFTDF